MAQWRHSRIYRMKDRASVALHFNEGSSPARVPISWKAQAPHITCHDASTSSFIVTSKCIRVVIAPRSLTHHDSISRSRSSARVFADTHTIHEERHNDPRLADCPLDSRHCDSKSICVIALVCVLIVVYAGVCLEAGIERRK
jgi:hypothetical protein